MAHENRYPSRPHILAKRIELARQRCGLGVRELVRVSGVDWHALHRLLTATSTDPSVWNIARLAVALGASTDYLVGLHEKNGRVTEEAYQRGYLGYVDIFD